MLRVILTALLWLAVLTVSPAGAEELRGRVIGVTDGDTLTVLIDGRRQVRIRLAAIDAPEHGQAYGQRSKDALSHAVFGKEVLVEAATHDRFGRLVGKVSVGGNDIGRAQIAAGMAWHYKKYADEQRPADREAYAAAELQARHRRLGLWADPRPIPPWEWRRREAGNASP